MWPVIWFGLVGQLIQVHCQSLRVSFHPSWCKLVERYAAHIYIKFVGSNPIQYAFFMDDFYDFKTYQTQLTWLSRLANILYGYHQNETTS